MNSWQIRDTIFRLFANWIKVLEKSNLKKGKIHHMLVYIRKGLKCICQNCGETFCRKLVLYMYCWFTGIPVFVSEQPENKLEDFNYKIRAEDKEC